MTDPVKEAVERLSRINAEPRDYAVTVHDAYAHEPIGQFWIDRDTVLSSHFRLEAENARLVKLVEEAGEDWASIETAPRDGTLIALAFGSDASTAGWYEDSDDDARPWKILDRGLTRGEFKSRNGLNGARDDKYGPTHWAPLRRASLPHKTTKDAQ